MIKATKSIRRDLAPLKVSVSMAASGAPLAQVFDALSPDGPQVTPSRVLTASVITPVIWAGSGDSSWPDARANKLIADIHWYANKVEITNAQTCPADWSGKFSVVTADTDSKGALTVLRDLDAGESVELVMAFTLADSRTGSVMNIRTDPVLLSCVAKADAEYSIDLPAGDVIVYDRVDDILDIDDWNKDNGQTAMAADERAKAAAMATTYPMTVPFRLRRGKGQVSSGSALKVELHKVASGSLSKVASVSSGVTKLPTLAAGPSLDLRHAAGTYALIAFVGAKEVARRMFEVRHRKPVIKPVLHNGVGFRDSDTKHTDSASFVTDDGRLVRAPERILSIEWRSKSASKGEVLHTSGSRTGVIDLAKAGASSSDEIEIWCQCEWKV